VGPILCFFNLKFNKKMIFPTFFDLSALWSRRQVDFKNGTLP